jgi:carbon-monoxide dehydrogenase large subunit
MGIGAALKEEYLPGQTSGFADYILPMAGEMPEIIIDHVSTPSRGTALGAKGAGEAGAGGAAPAVWCAVNDALRPFGAEVLEQPFTPERILDALAATQERPPL